MRKKAIFIGKSNWTTSKGNKISAKKLYETYSSTKKKNIKTDKNQANQKKYQTFIDYAKRATAELNLNDSEADALIKHHKRKIALAIKEGEKIYQNKKSK